MLLALPLLGGIIWGLLRGGRLAALEAVQVRFPLLLVLAFAPLLVLYTPLTNHSAWAIQASPLVYPVALALLVLALLANRHLSGGMYLIVAGLCLNLTVVVANGGSMPVDAAAMQRVRSPSYVHLMATRQIAVNTHLRNARSTLMPLGDIIPLAAPGGLGNVYSVGDVLVACGALVLGQAVVRPRRGQPDGAVRTAGEQHLD